MQLKHDRIYECLFSIRLIVVLSMSLILNYYILRIDLNIYFYIHLIFTTKHKL